MDIHQIQEEQKEWSARNFGEQPAYYALIGAVEEMGELCHAFLKTQQGIRGNQLESEQDAIGDTVIYLMDYCNKRGYDLMEIIEVTWRTVKQRDWKANPNNGVKD